MTTTLHASDRTLPRVPWLPPILRRSWRAADILQIGLDPGNAVVLRNISAVAASFLSTLDGSRDLAAAVEQSSLSRSDCFDLVRQLSDAGVLVDLAEPAAEAPSPAAHPALFGALAPEVYGRSLGSLAASPAETMRMRARAQVVVVGSGRLAVSTASILAASGICRIAAVQHGHVAPADCVPGGPEHHDVGRRRIDALGDAVRRANPRATVSLLGAHDRPDLVVLTEPVDPLSDRVRMLMRTRTPFLPALIRERRGITGPFVVPGESSCLACQEATRTALDRQWPAIRAQTLSQPVPLGEGGEMTLVMMTASLVCTQVLQWLDNERLPETINAALEIALPDLVLERRYWPRHAACSCRIP